jgi:hypothetical protein
MDVFVMETLLGLRRGAIAPRLAQPGNGDTNLK